MKINEGDLENRLFIRTSETRISPWGSIINLKLIYHLLPWPYPTVSYHLLPWPYPTFSYHLLPSVFTFHLLFISQMQQRENLISQMQQRENFNSQSSLPWQWLPWQWMQKREKFNSFVIRVILKKTKNICFQCNYC